MKKLLIELADASLVVCAGCWLLWMSIILFVSLMFGSLRAIQTDVLIWSVAIGLVIYGLKTLRWRQLGVKSWKQYISSISSRKLF